MNKAKDIIKQNAKIVLAQSNFYYFCNLMKPEMYDKKQSHYLYQICNDMQNFYESEDEQI